MSIEEQHSAPVLSLYHICRLRTADGQQLPRARGQTHIMAFLASRKNHLASAQPPCSPAFSTGRDSSSFPKHESSSSSSLLSSVSSAWRAPWLSLKVTAWLARSNEGSAGHSSSTPKSVHPTIRSIQLPRPNPRSRVRRCNSVSSRSSSESEPEPNAERDSSSSKPSRCWMDAISARIRSSTKSGTRSRCSLAALDLRE